MEENNVQIIQRILDGEEEAFSILVQKHQKRVHTIAWEKIGDYHIAQEITQDTFLQVYKRLSTLKNPQQFDGWLYVITTRLCINWLQRNKTSVQFIEDTPVEEIEQYYYNHYESEQRKAEATRHNHAIVKKLLAKLSESERTVMTLYYLGEMTAQEISKSLGVSVNTIYSKIRRARNRLKAEEELLITENLEGVQLSTDLTASIMREIVNIKPMPPVVKPVLPWAAVGTAAMLVLLLLGAINEYISHFQNPYNFDALSEPTIEIFESPIHIDINSTPTVRNKIGRGVTNNKSEGAGTIVSDADLAANVQKNGHNSQVVQWTQANGPQGSILFNLFANSDNNIYAVKRSGFYRLTEDGTTWMNVTASVPIKTFQSHITGHHGVIYSVTKNDIFASTNNGETWNRFCSRPNGDAVGLIIRGNTEENLIMYFALKDEGVFRSTDAGKTWISLNNGLTDKRISTVASIDDSVFIGTTSGLYRLKIEHWEQLPVDPLNTVHSMAVFEKNLYVVTGPDYLSSEFTETNSQHKMYRKIFHSTDFGSTWCDITPKDQSIYIRQLFVGPTKIYVYDKTLLVFGVPAFRSMDGGQNWTNLGFDGDLLPLKFFPVLAVNEKTFYRMYLSDILRTTDSGDTWHPFMNGMVNTRVQDVVAFNDRLYVYTGSRFFESADDGYSWEEMRIDYGEYLPKLTSSEDRLVKSVPDSKLIIANNKLYGIMPHGKEIRICRLRPEDGVFSMVHKISSPKLWKSGEDAKGTNVLGAERQPTFGGIAVSRDKTFYIEYMRRLFKWTPGNTEMIDTRLTDIETYIGNRYNKDFKLTTSAEVVYVGKRNGKLFRSIDGGNGWRDITSNISTSFSNIKDITFLGSTVYVATDIGVLTSQTGEHWCMLTDNLGTNIIIDKFAIFETNFYGAGDMGVYRLVSRGNWEQIVPSIPDKVISLSANHNKLYIGTEKRGIFHTSLLDASSETITAAIPTLK